MSFKEMNLSPRILDALSQANYTEPTPIQAQAIPPILEGKDLLGNAQTGTGKTAAFAVPVIQLLVNGQPTAGKTPIRALVLTPTRELAMQIYESFQAYSRFTRLKSCVVFGGVSQVPQVKKLQRGVDILIATPGRLGDLMNQGHIKLDRVSYFVLDEADRMLDMGFIADVRRILTRMPQQKQTLLFSATMPPEIKHLADELLHEPVQVSITPEAPTVDKIDQKLCYVDKANKRELLLHLLKDDQLRSVLVFTRTRHGADRVVRELETGGIAAAAIHSDKSQGARQSALNSFKRGAVRVLVATDIASRGIDIHELSCVVNYDLPDTAETYVHRIGRTGRAGQGGVAISFCCIDEKGDLNAIQKLLGKKLPVIEDHPFPMLIVTPTPKAGKGGRPRQQGRQGAGSFGARKPFEGAPRPRVQREDGPQRPRVQREDGSREGQRRDARPWQPREEGAQRPRPQREGAARPRVQREDGARDGQRRDARPPWQSREDGAQRPRQQRDGGFRPKSSRGEEGFRPKPQREEGSRDARDTRPRQPRSEGAREGGNTRNHAPARPKFVSKKDNGRSTKPNQRV